MQGISLEAGEIVLMTEEEFARFIDVGVHEHFHKVTDMRTGHYYRTSYVKSRSRSLSHQIQRHALLYHSWDADNQGWLTMSGGLAKHLRKLKARAGKVLPAKLVANIDFKEAERRVLAQALVSR